MHEPIELALGTKRYKILFDKAAIYTFEEENLKRLKRERGIFQFMAEIVKLVEQHEVPASGDGEPRGPSFTELTLALWAAMRTHHPNVPLEKLRGEVEPADYFRYMTILLQAFGAALPERPAGGESSAAENVVPLAPTPSSGG